ncbi:MAG: ABC transporter permease [Chloroflexi bacterium]|nr:ABC transporter permease [Chloroflexota bacterium]
MIYGARVTLIFALSSVAISGTVGATLGLLAGYYGSWVGTIIMRLADIVLSLPMILIAMSVVMVIGQSLFTMILVVSLLSWAGSARIARAETLSLKEREFVALARAAGVPGLKILWRHILPNLVNTLVVVATLSMAGIILVESTLSFLGVGIPAPDPAWGTMVSDGRQALDSAWWVSVFPGICIGAVVIALSLVGDWLRDRLDPRLRQV